MSDHVELLELIHAMLEGQLDADAATALKRRLRTDAQARATYIQAVDMKAALRWQFAEDRAPMLTAATDLMIDDCEAEPYAIRLRGRSRTTTSFGWSIAAAMVGLVVGFVTSSLVLGVMMSGNQIRVQPLLTEGFEDVKLPLAKRFPEVHDVWNGTQGLILPSDTAAEGHHVIRFGPTNTRRLSYLNRIVDVSGLEKAGTDEQRELRLTVTVRTSQHVSSPRRYRLRLAAFEEDPAAIKDLWFSGGGLEEKALSFASRAYDVDEPGWSTLDMTLPLPPEARNVVLSISAGSVDSNEPTIAYEADDVKLELITLQPGQSDSVDSPTKMKKKRRAERSENQFDHGGGLSSLTWNSLTLRQQCLLIK